MTITGIIAGGGVLPKLLAEQKKDSVFVIAFKGITDPEWIAGYPHQWIRLGQVGKLFSALKKNNVKNVVFAGHMQRPSWTGIRPDWQGLKLLWQLKKQPRGDDSLLRFLGNLFEARGFSLVGADKMLPDSIMPAGVLTKTAPHEEITDDIIYATTILKQWAQLDQGQSIVVQQGLILGIEASEGTDELIKRCGLYKRIGRGPVLVKIKKPQQDRRLDLPTIGLQTIKNCHAAGFSGIAVAAGDALFMHPVETISYADEHGLFIVGTSDAP